MRIKKSDGFTLLEVMMGLVIFTLGLLLLSTMMVVALRGNVWSDKTTQVVQSMREKVEDFRFAKVADMTNGSDAIKGLTRTWSFSDLTTNLKKLTVTVTWHDEKGTAKACSTITYIQVTS